MKDSEVKTIDVQTLKWFDKLYGNTYFAQEITLNYGMSNQETIKNDFQYGYSSYEHEAFKCLRKNGYFKRTENLYDLMYKRARKIIFRFSERYALKRELNNI
jgi:hypothetical protein